MINFGETNNGNLVIEIVADDVKLFKMMAIKQGVEVDDLLRNIVNDYLDKNDALLQEVLKEYKQEKQKV